MYKRLTLALICAGIFWAGASVAEPHLVFSVKFSVMGSGGLSGLDLKADGQSGITLSDRGELLAIALERDDGVLSAGTLVPWPTLSKVDGDIEGIAYSGNGPYFFSFEAPAHVISINDVGEIKKLAGHRVKGFQLYAFRKGAWQVVAHIPSRGFFMAVGADFGPNNLFYLLERSASPLGFRTRVRRFDLSQDDLTEEILLTTGQLSHDNLEGISVWVDPKGATRVTMISDDNFLPVLCSEVVEYVLHE